MKYPLSIFLIALLSFAAQLFSSIWWSSAIVSFIICLLFRYKSRTGFIISFLGIFLLWLLLSIRINSYNGHILAHKMAAILGVGSAFWFFMISSVVGGLVAGFSGASAGIFRKST